MHNNYFDLKIEALKCSLSVLPPPPSLPPSLLSLFSLPPSLLALPVLPPSESELEEVLLACSAVKNMTSLLLLDPLKKNLTKDSQAVTVVKSVGSKQDSGQHLAQGMK